MRVNLYMKPVNFKLNIYREWFQSKFSVLYIENINNKLAQVNVVGRHLDVKYSLIGFECCWSKNIFHSRVLESDHHL